MSLCDFRPARESTYLCKWPNLPISEQGGEVHIPILLSDLAIAAALHETHAADECHDLSPSWIGRLAGE